MTKDEESYLRNALSTHADTLRRTAQELKRREITPWHAANRLMNVADMLSKKRGKNDVR